MININYDEKEFKNIIRTAELKLKNMYVNKQITETEFKKRLRTVNLSKVYMKLDLIKFN